MGDSEGENDVRRKAEGEQAPLRKGSWTAEEDALLVAYVNEHGDGNWKKVQKSSGINRSAKSCRLRWANHLRPDLKKGAFSIQEELTIIELHEQLGNRWARMATMLPGRTDNEIKNYWNSLVRKTLRSGSKPSEEASTQGEPTLSSHGAHEMDASALDPYNVKVGSGSVISDVRGFAIGDNEMNHLRDVMRLRATRMKEFPYDSESHCFSTPNMRQMRMQQHSSSQTESLYSSNVHESGNDEGMYLHVNNRCTMSYVHGNDHVTLNPVDGSNHGTSFKYNNGSVHGHQSLFLPHVPQESSEMMHFYNTYQCITQNEIWLPRPQTESYTAHPSPGSLGQFPTYRFEPAAGNLSQTVPYDLDPGSFNQTVPCNPDPVSLPQASLGPCYSNTHRNYGSMLPVTTVPNSVASWNPAWNLNSFPVSGYQ